MIGLNMILANTASILCIGVSAFMLYHGKAGWGWFLFAALVLFVTVERKRDAR